VVAVAEKDLPTRWERFNAKIVNPKAYKSRICHACLSFQLRTAFRSVVSEKHASDKAEFGWGPEWEAMWMQQFVRGLLWRQTEHDWVQFELQLVSCAVL
jgi:hypothetical protein